MTSAIVLLVAAGLGLYLVLSRRLASSSSWKATVTPLASIMGSGFLVSAPLLAGAVGVRALLFMAGLLVVAYSVGGAIRFNIRHFEPVEGQRGVVQEVALASRIVLAGAYFISVSYYLQLLAAFALHAVGEDDPRLASTVTTALLITIGGIGMCRGLGGLERVTRYAVSLNLAMIGALLAGLLAYNARLVLSGTWELPSLGAELDLHDVRVVLGLLIVVQGFETSRYLGEEHPPEQRIRTMRAAQLLSATIYLVFIALTTCLFHPGLGTDVTAIIGLTAPVATVLPILISVAAIGSQFSAAVADTSGAGGLITDLTHGRLSARWGYLLILAVTVALTWETDVNQIISYASRAFALFYTLQCVVALGRVLQTPDLPGRGRQLVQFALSGVLCLAVFLFGLPAE